MPYQHIQIAREERVLVITINRPDVMNALAPQTHQELAQAFDAFERDDDLWVAIVTGAGPHAFCAGGDISAMQKAANSGNADDYQVPDSGYGGLTSRFTCTKPIIAAVNGMALGGGFEMVLSCDLAIAAEHARFGLPEPHIGAVAVASGAHRLIRQLPQKQAMYLLLTGSMIDAQQALAWGLVNEVVAADQLLDRARKLAAQLLKGAPISIRATKQLALEGLNYSSLQDALQAQEQGAYSELNQWQGCEDTQEGLSAFLEKRRPVWNNR